jgi:hypothetical protein
MKMFKGRKNWTNMKGLAEGALWSGCVPCFEHSLL